MPSDEEWLRNYRIQQRAQKDPLYAELVRQAMRDAPVIPEVKVRRKRTFLGRVDMEEKTHLRQIMARREVQRKNLEFEELEFKRRERHKRRMFDALGYDGPADICAEPLVLKRVAEEELERLDAAALNSFLACELPAPPWIVGSPLGRTSVTTLHRR